MFNFFKRSISYPEIDIHSHLLPGIDDGVKTLDRSIEIIKKFIDLGYKKLITTPHIHPNYPNTPEIIRMKLEELKGEVEKLNLEIVIDAAAEYYVDDVFFNRVQQKEELLTFGDNYVLVESGFINKPMIFESCLFELKSQGYNPILAHPERYQFLEENLGWLKELKSMGILLQLNIASLVGFFGSMPAKIGKQLIKEEMIDFLGSDLHNQHQLEPFQKGINSKSAQNLIRSDRLFNQKL